MWLSEQSWVNKASVALGAPWSRQWKSLKVHCTDMEGGGGIERDIKQRGITKAKQPQQWSCFETPRQKWMRKESMVYSGLLACGAVTVCPISCPINATECRHSFGSHTACNSAVLIWPKKGAFTLGFPLSTYWENGFCMLIELTKEQDWNHYESPPLVIY